VDGALERPWFIEWVCVLRREEEEREGKRREGKGKREVEARSRALQQKREEC
jgi:hypothetical protein